MIEYTIPILEKIESFIEILNLIFAFLIVFMGISILTKLQGNLKTAWTYLFYAIFLFGIHEIVGSLAAFNILSITAVYAITELLFTIMFIISIYVFKELFESLSSSISSRKKK